MLRPSLPLAKPAQTTNGDVLVATVAHQGGAQCLTPTPLGWTAVPGADAADGTNAGLQAWYRVTGADEPSSYTFRLEGLRAVGDGGRHPRHRERGRELTDQRRRGTDEREQQQPGVRASVRTTAPYTLLVFAAAASSSATGRSPV